MNLNLLKQHDDYTPKFYNSKRSKTVVMASLPWPEGLGSWHSLDEKPAAGSCKALLSHQCYADVSPAMHGQ